MKSRVGHLEEMKERFYFEKVFSLNSEGILLHQTICTQHLRVDLIRRGPNVATNLHLFLFVPRFLRILLALVVYHTLVITFVPDAYQIVEVGSQLLSFLGVHL